MPLLRDLIFYALPDTIIIIGLNINSRDVILVIGGIFNVLRASCFFLGGGGERRALTDSAVKKSLVSVKI